MTIYEGKLVSEQIRVGIVAARFNEFITSKLLGGALDGLKRLNVREEEIDVAWVPGAFEIPLAAAKMAASRNTMPSSAWAPSSAEAPAIMTMSAARCPRALPRPPFQTACL